MRLCLLVSGNKDPRNDDSNKTTNTLFKHNAKIEQGIELVVTTRYNNNVCRTHIPNILGILFACIRATWPGQQEQNDTSESYRRKTYFCLLTSSTKYLTHQNTWHNDFFFYSCNSIFVNSYSVTRRQKQNDTSEVATESYRRKMCFRLLASWTKYNCC